MRLRVEGTADRQFGTNSYLLEDEDTRDAVVIDANFEPELILDLIRRRGATVRAVALTHTDVDHIAGLRRLLAEHPVPVAVHDAEREVLADGKPLRRQLPIEPSPVHDLQRLAEGELFKAGSIELEVLHTPGHSPGGVSLRADGIVFTGDALFAGSIGRSDFHNSDPAALLEGIKGKLLTLPDETVVYSGHGPATTIGQERRYNPFL